MAVVMVMVLMNEDDDDEHGDGYGACQDKGRMSIVTMLLKMVRNMTALILSFLTVVFACVQRSVCSLESMAHSTLCR